MYLKGSQQFVKSLPVEPPPPGSDANSRAPHPATNTMRALQLPLLLAATLAPSSLAAALPQAAPRSQKTHVHLTRDGLTERVETSTRAGAGTSLALTLSPSSLLWRVTSDGSWIAETVSLGDRGGQVFSERGAFDNHTQLYSAFDASGPTPVWSDDRVLFNFAPRVRSSEIGGVHIALHQEYSDSLQVWRQGVLRKYSATTAGAPEWTYTSPLLTLNEKHTSCALSADGQTILLLAYNASSLETQATVFGAGSSLPVQDLPLPTLGEPLAFSLSADGSTLAVASNLKLVVLDVATGLIVEEQLLLGEPQYGALALSGDGDLLARGTLGRVSLAQRGAGGGYGEVLSLPFSATTYCRRVDLSDDGSTLVAGLSDSTQSASARLVSLDVASAQILIDVTLSGSGADLNLVHRLECSASGQRFAAGLWGDSAGEVPQVLVFRRDSPEPILADSLPGSVLELDLSADGRRLAVASKGTHAMQWGSGGDLSLYRVGSPELDVQGIPHLGATVEVRHHLRPGSQSKLLVATALAAAPAEAPELGTGNLYLDPATLWELPAATADLDAVASHALGLPSSSASLGSSYYVQAVDLATGELSRTWLQVSILP